MDIKPALSDKYLFEEIKKLKNKYNCKKFIETGAWKGYSADIASNIFDEVISIELNDNLYKQAVANNESNKNVKVLFGDTKEILYSILSKDYDNSIFFLDAHWYEYCPLLDELNAIYKTGIKPVIVIHDFYVPNEFGEAKFGYDSYNEQPLNYEYVKQQIDNIYGSDGYIYYYLDNSEINSGVVIFLKK